MFKKITFIALLLGGIYQVSSQNSSDEDEIRLFYYPNTQNASERIQIDLYNASSFSLILDKYRRAKILVHGANGHCATNGFPATSIQAYLYMKGSGKEDYNVFCLDYQEVAKVPYSGIPGNDKPNPAQRFEYVANLVGNKTARYILALQKNGVIPSVSEVHIIGHSLGGQVVGVTGRKVQEMLNFKSQLGRITGLDVMNTFIVYQNEIKLANQIDSSDASFVDIVHTNDGQVGLKGDYGRVDYYPDGGQHQNNCLQNGPIYDFIERLTGWCSHGIVGNYWANSILNSTIQACKANSYEDFKQKQNQYQCTGDSNIPFGEHVSLSAFGKFYLDYPVVKK